MKKMEQGAVGIVLGDECAAALAADDEILRRQIVQRLADGALADPEFLRELHFARQRGAGLPDAFDQALEQERPYLGVERSRLRRGRIDGRNHGRLRPVDSAIALMSYIRLRLSPNQEITWRGFRDRKSVAEGKRVSVRVTT